MPNRYQAALRLLCIGLAAILVILIASEVFKADPFGKLQIPKVPSLDTNSPAKGQTNAASTNALGGTNIASTNALRATNVASTNQAGSTNVAGTNAASATNLAATNIARGTNIASTNVLRATNAESTNALGATNVASTNQAGSTSVAATNAASATNLATINIARGTNVADTNVAGTNALGSTNLTAARGTNLPPSGAMPPGMRGGPGMPGMMGMPGTPGGPGGPLPQLSPLVKARIDKIVDKEILAPVQRPMPAALLGIADQSAFLRSTNGQTGIAKVGEAVGGLKVLRIGYNRVLVEQGGQTNELTLFNGYGSESLLKESSK